MFEMDNQQVLMFKEWFIDTYPECKDYLDLTYFDVEKNTFLSKCSYNPDSGNAAKVLRIALGSWQHQQAKVEELEGKLKQAYEDVDTFAEAHERECGFKARLAKDKAELQKRIDDSIFILSTIDNPDEAYKAIDLLLRALRGEQALKGEG